jgi:hypothetical protein
MQLKNYRIIIGVLIIGMFTLSGTAVSASDSYTYSLMHISDTQTLSASYPSTLNLTFSYLESIQSTFNISAIIITGDLVDDGNNISQWNNYADARSLTTIPLYEIPGNHDVNVEVGNPYYEFVASRMNWTAEINDFIFIGIGYSGDPLSDSDVSYYTSVIKESPQKFVIIAAHDYFNHDLSLSPLGNSIRDHLVLKPTFVMSGHAHESLVHVSSLHNIPYIEDLTDYQENGDFSAGKLYTVYVTDGNVTKITVREVFIAPYAYMNPEKIVYQVTTENPTYQPSGYPMKSQTDYPKSQKIYPSISSYPYPPKPKIAIPNASPEIFPTKSPILYLYAVMKVCPFSFSDAYPPKSQAIDSDASHTTYVTKSPVIYSIF